MNKSPDLPDGWAMPDDLAKKINEVLNNKRITPEDELADALEDLARDNALIWPSFSIQGLLKYKDSAIILWKNPL